MKRHKFDLAALKAKALPRCTYDTLVAAIGLKITPVEGAAQEEVERQIAELRVSVDKQVAPFIPPQRECIGCGSVIAGAGLVEAFMLATFTYGMAHGEGFCRNCGYPARANHYADKEAGGLSFMRVLQYHPDELIERRPVEAQP